MVKLLEKLDLRYHTGMRRPFLWPSLSRDLIPQQPLLNARVVVEWLVLRAAERSKVSLGINYIREEASTLLVVT